MNTSKSKIDNFTCLRAHDVGDKLRRIINTKREDGMNTIYTRWGAKKRTKELHEKLDKE